MRLRRRRRAGLKCRSCAPRRWQCETRISLARLVPVLFAHGPAAKQAALDQPGNIGEELAGAGGDAVCCRKFTAGEGRAYKCRAAAGEILDRSEQEVVDGFGKAAFASQQIGFVKPRSGPGEFWRPLDF